MLRLQLFNCKLSAIMSETNNFSYYGGYSHEVNDVYEDPINSFPDLYNDYSYPQSTSFSGRYFYDGPNDSYSYETTYYEYYPTYCLHPSYMTYYPEIHVHDYSPLYIYYQYYVYYPVYSYYYVGNDDYTLPASEYYGSSSVDQSDLYESDVKPSSKESSLDTYEAFDSSLYNTAFGYHVDAYNYGNIVGEEQTTCYFFYEERHEDNNAPPNDEDSNAPPDDDDNNAPLDDDDNNAPPDDEDTSFPSGSSLEQNAACNIPAANEIEVSQFVDQEPQSSNESDVREEDTNENITGPLSPTEIKEIKREINRAYEHFKSNLFNDVDTGYKDMREFLKNIKWRYDHFKRNIAIRKQEEKLNRTYDMKNYYFHDDLTTIRPRFRYQDDIEFYVLDQLLRAMNVSDLKKWMKDNYKMKKVKVYKKECKGHQNVEMILQKLQWEPATLCRIPEDEPLETTELEFLQNSARALNNISRQKWYIQKKNKKRKKKKNEEKNVDAIEKDRETVITVEDQHPPSTSHESTDLPSPEKSENLLCKEMLDFESPVTAKDLYSALESLDSTDLSTPEKSEISSRTEEQDSENPIIAEDPLPSSSSHECVELPDPEKIEMPSIKEQLQSNNTEEDLHPAVEYTCRLEDTPEVSSNEEHESVSVKTVEDSDFVMPSGDKMEENGSLSILDATESTLAAAAQKDQPKKKFSSIRKFLSRMCCCTKTPPSS